MASIPTVRYHRVLAQILLKRNFKQEKFGVMDETHMRFFTQKSIVSISVEAGYDIVHLDPINKGKSIRPLFYQLLSLELIGRDIRYPQFAVVTRNVR